MQAPKKARTNFRLNDQPEQERMTDVSNARRKLQKCFLPEDMESKVTIAKDALQSLEEDLDLTDLDLTKSIMTATKLGKFLKEMQKHSSVPAIIQDRSAALLKKWSGAEERNIPRDNRLKREQLEKDALYTRHQLQRCFPQVGRKDSDLTIARHQLQLLEDTPNLPQSIIANTKIAKTLRKTQSNSLAPDIIRDRCTALLNQWEQRIEAENPRGRSSAP